MTVRMYEEIELVFNWVDIQALRPDWSEDDCQTALIVIADEVDERVSDYALELMAGLLPEKIEEL